MTAHPCSDCGAPAAICESCSAIGLRDVADKLDEILDHEGTLKDVRAYARRLRERAELVIGPEQAPTSSIGRFVDEVAS